MGTLRTRLVTEAEYFAAHREMGSVYFVRNVHLDTIKIGHTTDPARRLSELQVANSHTLKIVGLIAATPQIERIIHFQLMEGRISGEWFWDRGVTTDWLMRMTLGEPLRRNIWEIIA